MMMHNPEVDDYIGGESCSDFTPHVPVDTPTRKAEKSRRPRRLFVAEKEYPPVIQQFPWIMTRYSTSDGRLVIKEEIPKRYHYLRVHRSNGRLLLDLVEEANSNDSGDDETFNDDGIDPTVVDDREGEGVSSHEIESHACGSEVGVNPCGGFGVQVAAFRPPVLT